MTTGAPGAPGNTGATTGTQHHSQPRVTRGTLPAVTRKRHLPRAWVLAAALILPSACAHTPPTPRNVHFDSAKDEPRNDDDYVVIGRALATMDAEPKLRLLVVGHTDSDGDAESNRQLAFKRANKVRAILVDQDASLIHRLDLAYFGKDRPIAENDSEEGKAKNRRVELYFYYPKTNETNEVKLQRDFGGSLEFQASGSVSVN